MNKNKSDEILKEAKDRLTEDYFGDSALREQFKTVDEFIKSKVTGMFAMLEFERDPAIKAEFGRPEIYAAFKQAEAVGKVKIIGNKQVS